MPLPAAQINGHVRTTAIPTHGAAAARGGQSARHSCPEATPSHARHRAPDPKDQKKSGRRSQ